VSSRELKADKVARSRPNDTDPDWLRNVAIAIISGLMIQHFFKVWGSSSSTPRKPGKVVPSVVPQGLPAFPAGWEPYQNPSSTIVGKRAAELLFQLWGQGEGATVTEQTPGLSNGQWVTYQAQVHQEGTAKKKGVGAWRVKEAVHGAVA
jgi:hypothetical protein